MAELWYSLFINGIFLHRETYSFPVMNNQHLLIAMAKYGYNDISSKMLVSPQQNNIRAETLVQTAVSQTNRNRKLSEVPVLMQP